jgi:mannose-6-phosphate isomerase-like protein (cupin superfamily)
MKKDFPYATHLDIKYQHQKVIDIPKIIGDCNERWYNQSLVLVNESVVRIGIIEGEYHWHKHDHDDEFFFVLDGQLIIDLEKESAVLEKGQAMTISKGVLHRTRASKKTVILMVETKSIVPTGD